MNAVLKSVCPEEAFNDVAKLELPNNQVLLACILLLPKDSGPILTLLKQIGTSTSSSSASQMTEVRTMPPPQSQADRWLGHSEAADYLGMAKSTLYRFVCEGRIETRKLGGRLEYSRLTLDKFKEQQIRPARRPRTRAIIAPTLGSGK